MVADGGGNTERPEEHVLHVQIRAQDFESLRPLLLEDLDFGCRPHPTRHPAGGVALQAYVAEAEVGSLRERGFEVEVVADMTVAWRERQQDVGRGDRFEGGAIAPRGLGIKTGRRAPPL